MKLRQYQIIPTNNVIKNLILGKKVILAGCPGSGKTEMSIYIIKMFLDIGKKVLVLAHSTNVLKKNFQERWNDYYDNHPNLTICIPQSYKADKYDLLVMDEAHENYLAKVVQNIAKDIPAQLLLTGTPSKLILEGQKDKKPFEIEVIAMEDIPREFFAKTGIELLSTCYKWTETDYNNDGNLKSSASITKSDTELAIDNVVLKLIDRLRNKSISAEKFNKPGLLTRIQKAIFRSSNLGKTMFVCARKAQADYVNSYLVSKGYNSKVSHSDSDNNSSLFKSFKNGEFDVLVVVNRGRLGFSDDNLMNIIDMSGTKNPDLIYQMFARCVRGNQSQSKLFLKLAPTGNAMHDLTAVSVNMALSLMFKDVISVFNGKNMKGMFIPVFKTKSENKQTKTKSEKSKSEVKERVIFPEYHTDVLVELKAIRYSLDDELSIYKKGEIGEIISQITGRPSFDKSPNGYWDNKDICKKESLKYKKRSEFFRNSGSCYNSCKSNGWLDEVCEHMDGKGYLPIGYWTLEKSKKEALKYKSRVDFVKGSSACYQVCRSNGWMDEVCSHMDYKIRPSKYFTFEEVKKTISIYNTRQDLKKSDINLYNVINKRGWMDELFKDKPNNGFKLRIADITKEQSQEKSLLCKTRREFSLKYPAEYKAAFRNGWLDEFIPFTPGQQGIGRKPKHKGPNGRFVKK
jgi:superfamily II DNA or RNA helicase